MDDQSPADPRAPAAPAAPAGPVVAGRYRVERLIARGGMAAVFLAEQIALRRRVALKILHPPPDAEESGNYAQRFRLEAETLATLDHPNIVTLYDYGGAEEGRFYLAMEYIDGPRYTDLLAGGALAPDRTIQLLLQVCAALRYAHKRGVIHRDLKPSNLLIRTDAEGAEQLKVVDFGLVKVTEIDQSLTREGLVLGSPHCMAPEQVRGSTTIDHRADIYAIGILLFRSLTGTYPFHGGTSTATMVAHLNEPIPTFASVAPDLKVPPRLEQVTRRCLAKRPQDRYPDVATLMEELAACVGLPIAADTQSVSRGELETAEVAPPPAAPDRRGLYLGIGVAVALALGALGFALSGGGAGTTGAPPGVLGAPTGVGGEPGAGAAGADGAGAAGADGAGTSGAPGAGVGGAGGTANPASGADAATGGTAGADAGGAPGAAGAGADGVGDAGTPGDAGTSGTAAGGTPGATRGAGAGAASGAATKPGRDDGAGARRPTTAPASPPPETQPAGTKKPDSPEGYMPLPDDFK